jgi:hypothetical protein
VPRVQHPRALGPRRQVRRAGIDFMKLRFGQKVFGQIYCLYKIS